MDIFAPLQWLADWLTYSVFSLGRGSHLAGSVNFFVYDSLKIIVLLIAINYLMAVIRYYLPVEKIRGLIAGRKWYGAEYLLASLFGAITPFCSCSSIPFFVGFVGAGIPLGVTFSFLITSPLVNEAAIVLLGGLFGLKLMVVYVTASVAMGVVGGILLGRVDIRKHINPDILALTKQVVSTGDLPANKYSRKLWGMWWCEGYDITKKLIPYILVGVGLGAVIHGYVPQYFFEQTLASSAWWTVPVATIVAVPLYSNAVGVVPVVQALVLAGIPIGTAFAFMMATVGLSLPEALILKKIMSLRLLAFYFGVITLGIILIGFLVNGLF
jgi:hypothetical protein